MQIAPSTGIRALRRFRPLPASDAKPGKCRPISALLDGVFLEDPLDPLEGLVDRLFRGHPLFITLR
jgi:hypothetical protein